MVGAKVQRDMGTCMRSVTEILKWNGGASTHFDLLIPLTEHKSKNTLFLEWKGVKNFKMTKPFDKPISKGRSKLEKKIFIFPKLW